jgi:hypothetical protein
LQQHPAQRLALRRMQMPGAPQGLAPKLANGSVHRGKLSRPVAYRLPRNTQSTRHLRLRHLALEQACAFEPSRFDRFYISFGHTFPST